MRRLIATLTAPDGGVVSGVAFSPDGRTLAFARRWRSRLPVPHERPIWAASVRLTISYEAARQAFAVPVPGSCRYLMVWPGCRGGAGACRSGPMAVSLPDHARGARGHRGAQRSRSDAVGALGPRVPRAGTIGRCGAWGSRGRFGQAAGGAGRGGVPGAAWRRWARPHRHSHMRGSGSQVL